MRHMTAASAVTADTANRKVRTCANRRATSRCAARAPRGRPHSWTSRCHEGVADGSGRGRDDDAFHRLSRDLGDQLEVLVQVQHDVTVGLCCRGDQQVRDGRSTVVAALGQDRLPSR